MNKIPIQFLGNKKRYQDEITSLFVGKARVHSVLDLFSGSSTISYALKQVGLRVISNDFLAFCYHLAKALVENDSVQVPPAHVLTLPVTSADTWITDLYGDKVFFKTDTQFLDRLRYQIRTLLPMAKSMAIAATACAMIAKSSYGRFNVGLNNHLVPKKFHKHKARTLRDYFVEKLKSLNGLVFDNGEKNTALHLDALSDEIASIEADGCYFDPPYPTYRRKTAYEYFYHVVETWTEYDRSWDIQAEGLIQKTRVSSFSGPRDTMKGVLTRMFEVTDHIPVWVIHYSDHCVPKPEYVLGLMRYFGRKATHQEAEANFSKSAWSHHRQPTEYIILAEK